MKTTIINKTTQSFDLKEGNAGAFRFLMQLGASAKASIKVDPNATYREYVVAAGKTGENIFLTSDDFSESEVISIVEVEEGGRTVYKSESSKPRNKGFSAARGVSSAGTAAAGAESASSGPPGYPPRRSSPVGPVVPPVDGGQATSSESSPAALGPQATTKAPWYKRVFK